MVYFKNESDGKGFRCRGVLAYIQLQDNPGKAVNDVRVKLWVSVTHRI